MVLNIFLDVFMVYSLHMGAGGVAWATLIAQGISAVAAFVLFEGGSNTQEPAYAGEL
jgi:Na+-driven multidrug efflux pump